jgi:DNA-binding NarL/FixJ family response regulator
VQLFPPLVPILALLLTMRGRLAEATECEEGAIEAARLVDNAQALAWALFHRAFTALQADDLDTALAAGAESFELTPGPDPNVVACYSGMVFGVAQIERGDPAEGVRLMVLRGGGEHLPKLPSAWRGYWLDQLVHGLLALDRRDEAERAAAAASALAQATGLRFAAMSAHRAAARVALAAGARGAAEHALAAAAAAGEIGAPVEAAVSRTLAGTALALAGEQDRAVAELTAAAGQLDAHGAIRHRDAAEREPRRLGARHLHRRTRAGKADGSGIETLTERELQVARLVVDRKTNPQIAAELFLSPKTVEAHIRHLFEKLDVSSRVEIARVVERADRAAGELGSA